MQAIWTLLGMLAAVAAVLVLTWLTTRWIGARGMPGLQEGAGDRRLRVLRQISVGKNERLILVQVLERCLLVGVTGGGMTVLLELGEAEAEELLRQSERETPPSFKDALRQTMQRKK